MPLLGKTKHDVLSEFRSSEILAAARQVFAIKGFNEATVDAIAECAGVSKGTVYLYFSSKRDIYLAALHQGISEMMDLTKTAMDAAQGSRAKIQAFVRTRLEYLERHSEFFRIYHAEFGNITHTEGFCEDFKNLYKCQLQTIESTLCRGMESGEIRPGPAAARAAAIYEMTRGISVRRLLGWSQGPVDADVQDLIDLLWKGIAN